MNGMDGMDPRVMQMLMSQRGGGMPGMGMGMPGMSPGMQGGFGGAESMSQQMPQFPKPAPPPVANLGLSPGPSTQQFGQGMPQFSAQPSPLQQQFASQQQMTAQPGQQQNWWDKNSGKVSQGLFALSNIL